MTSAPPCLAGVGQIPRPSNAAGGHEEDLALEGDHVKVNASRRDPELPAIEHGGHEISPDLVAQLIQFSLQHKVPSEDAHQNHRAKDHLVERDLVERCGPFP